MHHAAIPTHALFNLPVIVITIAQCVAALHCRLNTLVVLAVPGGQAALRRAPSNSLLQKLLGFSV
jgi:hypothetical protein